MTQTLYIPRLNDKSLIKCFRQLSEEYDLPAISINVLGAGSISGIDLKEENENISFLQSQNNALIVSTSFFNLSGFSIVFYRGGATEPKSPYHDEIHINYTPQNCTLDTIERLKISSYLSKELKAYTPERIVGQMSEEQQQLESIHSSTLDRLETINEDILNSTHKYREELDAKQDKKLQALETAYDSKEKSLQESYAKKQKALEDEKNALELKEKALDNKNNTHARREIRRDILKEIKGRQEKFKLTEGTNKLRIPINIAMWSLIGFFIIMSVSTAFELHISFITPESLEKSFIILSIKQILYSMGAVGSLIFYIKWLNKWFEQHSSTEFQLKKFELDMERASWLVETNLEWNDKKDSIMPTELLKSLSNNLFEYDKVEHESVIHPADQLASALLGSATAVKLKSGDSSIEIDPKKLSKAKI